MKSDKKLINILVNDITAIVTMIQNKHFSGLFLKNAENVLVKYSTDFKLTKQNQFQRV